VKIISSQKDSRAKDEVLSRSYNDLIYFGRAFLPKDFLDKSTTPEFHYEVAKKLITTKPGARICNILPRGFGKSILSKAAILHKICFTSKDERNFISWVAEEQGQAIDHLKYIKTHIEYNQQIRYYFGNLAGDSVGNRWTEKDIVTSKGDRVIAKGTSQRLRGRAEIDVRYTGIVLDDFESELNTKTPERRELIKQWVVSTVFPALEETPGNEGWIWLAGTIVHYDSFLQMIVDGYNTAKKNNADYPWDVTFYRAIEDGIPLWSDQFSVKKLESKKKEFIEAGLVNKFAQEYMNDARDISSASFKIDKIQYYTGSYESKGRFSYLVTGKDAIPINVYIGVDVAATATSTSDYQVVLVLGVDSNNNRYVLEYFRDRIPTFDVPEKIIDLAKKYSPVKRVTIETVAAQEMVRDMVTRMAANDRRLIPGIFKGVRPPAGIKKADRLETSLGPIVNTKKLYIRREMTEIVDEFFEHPLPKNDDILDALYYADYFAKAPRSSTIDIDMYEQRDDKPKVIKSVYNWMTGAKI
jgi:phage terminase large subunit-like protein|tara:strand:+ start:14039 stop:15616 length:1578 start_codon:yes stop_codon:yes gene_type:complete